MQAKKQIGSLATIILRWLANQADQATAIHRAQEEFKSRGYSPAAIHVAIHELYSANYINVVTFH